MSDTIAQDATPHPRHGIRRRPASNSSSPQHPYDLNDDNSHDNDSDEDLETFSRPHSRQSSTVNSKSSSSRPKSREGGAGFRSSIFGHHSKSQEGSENDDDDDDISGDSDFDNDLSSSEEDSDSVYGLEGKGRRGRRRRRISTSASHILAQAPPVPDLRFDTNYRKALDQIYEAHARESAHVAELHAAKIASVASSESPTSLLSVAPEKEQEVRIKTIPSIVARVTVMTLRDIIIMPFVHGFFWGFGTVLLTLVNQRSLFYHIHKTWRRIFGGDLDEIPIVVRGQPARVRTSGGSGFGSTGSRGFGGIGLMNAGSAASAGQQQQGFGRPAARVY